MNTKDYIIKKTKKGKLHFSLLDPDKQKPERAGEIARIVTRAGSTAIMVGGSTLSSQREVDITVKAIKKNTDLPVILFPSSARFLSRYADAVFFMSLLNSNKPEYIIREQAKGAIFVKKTGIEPLSMGYLIVEPGMTVGRVGDADLIKKDDVDTAIGYALASQYLGMDFFYLEAGSGASYPISNDMIKAVKKNTDIILIVGGGINDHEIAREKAEAGADIIVTGTSLERGDNNLYQRVHDIIKAIKEI
ncbi:MAG: geranylgeranylglyceryl/heptaprenylglyceryl phosphate synthase [Candidatus Thermoplasmatota archaeon]